MDIQKESIIGDVVAHDYRAASVFKKFGIDFCCNGNRSIGDACADKNIDDSEIINAVNNVLSNNTGQGGIDFTSWPLDLLADYIEKKHHRYVDSKIEDILPYLQKIARVHGGRHSELLEVEQLFSASAKELTSHMREEEAVIFPKIRSLVNGNTNDEETLDQSIAELMHQHDQEGERFRRIDALTNGYTTPEDGCNTYRVTLAMLKEFEEDLHLHIHLENNILFPKALEIEHKTVNA
ncbi:MAG: iron-sulfur cluster repair di-iron protein [Chitinophagales bacterium]|nr:iron-sulfur cluster repair di-iron protein [Chitinophagales bacterium]